LRLLDQILPAVNYLFGRQTQWDLRQSAASISCRQSFQFGDVIRPSACRSGLLLLLSPIFPARRAAAMNPVERCVYEYLFLRLSGIGKCLQSGHPNEVNRACAGIDLNCRPARVVRW